jgi:anthranilate phosphoribosyltransferase
MGQRRSQRFTPVIAASFCCATRWRAKTFREVCPEGRIVSITDQPLNQPPDADVVIYGVDGAEALIEAVRGDVTSEPRF